MIFAKIKQQGLFLQANTCAIPFKLSSNIKVQFIRDNTYQNYKLTGYYIAPNSDKTTLLDIDSDDTFILSSKAFKDNGILQLSFCLSNEEHDVHLGIIEFKIRNAFGDSTAILPEQSETWVSLVSNVAKDAIKEDVENLITGFDNHVNKKTNEFNNNAIEKNNSFGNKVTQANNSLDTKLQEANTAIDNKVREATKQATKAKEHAEIAKTEAAKVPDLLNDKLDKNQGMINKGKVLIVGEDGNVIPGEVEIKDSYTKEEVDYMLGDKMDKPYVPIKISDNTLIENTLNGNFKIDSIEGNILENKESNIIPTPDRPIPIISKKIEINNELVELRSLKESKNLFDKNIASFVFGSIGSDGTIQSNNKNYAVSGYIMVEPSTEYTVKIVDGFRASTKVYFDKDKLAISNNPANIFTTPPKCHFIRYQTATNDTRPLTVEDIDKINNETMLVKGRNMPSSYVPPTVRDYKIVDHVAKTSKIVRNVVTKQLERDDVDFMDGRYGVLRKFGTVGRFNIESSFSDKMAYVVKGQEEQLNNLFTFSGAGLIELYVRDFTTLEEYRTWIDQNKPIIQTALKNQIIEEIPYIESDTSEIGQTFQDSNSPSLSIPSEILEVKDINIRVVGKNLFDLEQAKDINNYKLISVNNTEISAIIYTLKSNTKYTISCKLHNANVSVNVGNSTLRMLLHDGPTRTITTNKDGIIYIGFVKGFINTNVLGTQYQDIQLEENSAATNYAPYKEISIKHHLTKPLMRVDDFFDYIDVMNGVRIGRIKKVDFTKIKIWSGEENASYNGENTTNRYGLLDTPAIQNYCLSNILNRKEYVWVYDVEGITINAGVQLHIRINNNILGITKEDTDEERTIKFKSYIDSLKGTGNEFVYVAIETPTSEPLEQDLIEKLKKLKTFSPVTNVFIEGVVKPTLNAKYPKDVLLAQQQLEQKIIKLQEVTLRNV